MSLQSTRLGDLRNDYDPSQTYEGENNMIVLQAANYLLGMYERLRKGIRSPFYVRSDEMLAQTAPRCVRRSPRSTTSARR